MSRRASLYTALLVGSVGMLDHGPRVRLPSARPKPRPAGVIGEPCPRCKAEPGQDCDRHTLGRRMYHKARVDALAAVKLMAKMEDE